MKQVALSLYKYFDTFFIFGWSTLTVKIATLITESGFTSITKDVQNTISLMTVLVGLFWGSFRLFRDWDNHKLHKKIKAEELKKLQLENQKSQIENNEKVMPQFLFRDDIDNLKENGKFEESANRLKQ